MVHSLHWQYVMRFSVISLRAEMTILTLQSHNFDSTILAHDTIVVDFWAKWCGPCLAFAGVFESASKHHLDVIFAKVDIESSPDLVSDFQIRSIPHLMIFRREFAVLSQSGIMTANQLNELLLAAKKISIDSLRKSLPK